MTPNLLLSLFGRFSSLFLVPAKTASAVARRRGQGRPDGRRAGRASLDDAEHDRTLAVVGLRATTSRALRAAAVASALAICRISLGAEGAKAQTRVVPPAEIASHMAEASHRSGLPEAWIRAIAWVESGEEVHAVSSKGAMGLMQIMPATWRDLQTDLGLGSDPFDPRDNLLAGAVYLRRMFDRFGADGFLAAYNAGPSRYQAFLDGRKRLPLETITYTAQVRARLARMAAGQRAPRERSAMDWRASELFAGGETAGSLNRAAAGDGPLFAPFMAETER